MGIVGSPVGSTPVQAPTGASHFGVSSQLAGPGRLGVRLRSDEAGILILRHRVEGLPVPLRLISGPAGDDVPPAAPRQPLPPRPQGPAGRALPGGGHPPHPEPRPPLSQAGGLRVHLLGVAPKRGLRAIFGDFFVVLFRRCAFG